MLIEKLDSVVCLQLHKAVFSYSGVILIFLSWANFKKIKRYFWLILDDFDDKWISLQISLQRKKINRWFFAWSDKSFPVISAILHIYQNNLNKYNFFIYKFTCHRVNKTFIIWTSPKLNLSMFSNPTCFARVCKSFLVFCLICLS